MKINDMIEYAYEHIFKNKKNIIFVILLIISFIAVLGSLTFYKLYHDSLQYSFKENIIYRRLWVYPKKEDEEDAINMVDKDYGFDELLNIEHVVGWHNLDFDHFYPDSSFKNDKYDGRIALLYGANYNMPKNIIGKSINDNNTGVAVCDNKFYPGGITFEDANNIKSTDFLEGEKLIGTTFKIYTDTFYKDESGALKKGEKYIKEFKIVGTFENLTGIESHGGCYISPKDMKALHIDTGHYLAYGFSPVALVTVDKQENLHDVANNIINLGHKVKTEVVYDVSETKVVNIISFMICFYAIMGILLIAILFIRKSILNEKQDIGLLKTLGYKNKDIKNIYIVKLVILLLLSLVIGGIIFGIIIVILKLYFASTIRLNDLYIKLSFLPFVVSIMICFILPLVSSAFINNLLKKSTINLVNSEKL